MLSSIEKTISSILNQEQDGFWEGLLLAIAPADERFLKLKTMVAQDHPMPWDLMPEVRSVLVFFLKFKDILLHENKVGDLPAKSWGMAYESTNRLLVRLMEGVSRVMMEGGYKTVLTPPTHNFDRERLISLWSHKHLGYLAHLGTFGRNCQLITPLGCGGRLGSLLTNCLLPSTPAWNHGEMCLGKRGIECNRCIEACPPRALTEDGIKKQVCFQRLQENIRSAPTLKGLNPSTHVCGKCVVVCPAKAESLPEGLLYIRVAL
jgi:epoxyqueuosine reductase